VDANGNAILSTSQLAVGDHKITAIYGSDNNHYSSTSAQLDQQVTAAPPTGTLTIYDGNGNAMASGASGVVFITPSGGSRVKATIQVTMPTGCEDEVELDYDCTHLIVYGANQQFIAPNTDVTDGETVYVGGTSPSDSVNDSDITVLDATTSSTLAQVDFTAVSVSMKSITFTSDYHGSPVLVSSGGGPTTVTENVVNMATNLSDAGVAAPIAYANGTPIGSADWSSQTGKSYAIAQQMGTGLSLTAVIDVQPANFEYTITSTSWSTGDMAGSYMNLLGDVTTASGGDDQVELESAESLPNMVTKLNQGVLWTISDGNRSFAEALGTTTHEILVTFGNPINTLSTLPGFPGGQFGITDKRLETAVAACAGSGENPSQNDLAAAIQHWLPSNAWWSGTGAKPITADQYWAIAGPTDPGYYSNCFEFASLEELMLKTLGVNAQREMIFPTLSNVWAAGNANFMSSSHTSTGDPLRTYNGNPVVLVFNFPRSGLNTGEGVVRVGSCVYTEGGGALVVGQDGAMCLSSDVGVQCTAELDALVELVELMESNGASVNTFQDWATYNPITQAGTIRAGDPYEPLPPIESAD
jgi:hypothetical protein